MKFCQEDIVTNSPTKRFWAPLPLQLGLNITSGSLLPQVNSITRYSFIAQDCLLSGVTPYLLSYLLVYMLRTFYSFFWYLLTYLFAYFINNLLESLLTFLTCLEAQNWPKIRWSIVNVFSESQHMKKDAMKWFVSRMLQSFFLPSSFKSFIKFYFEFSPLPVYRPDFIYLI